MVCAGLVLTGCTGTPAASTTGGDASVHATSSTGIPGVGVAELRRPLALPSVGAGQAYPVTLARHQPDPNLGVIQGTGPGGPAGISTNGILAFVGPASATAWTDKSWGGQKVLWAVDGSLSGPVLVRGRQLDGKHEVWFNDPAVGELVLEPKSPAAPGGWRDYPSDTRLRAPGCYAYQVDTEAGTTVIAFRAEGPLVSG